MIGLRVSSGRIGDNGVERDVEFLGEVPDDALIDLYRSADVLAGIQQFRIFPPLVPHLRAGRLTRTRTLVATRRAIDGCSGTVTLQLGTTLDAIA